MTVGAEQGEIAEVGSPVVIAPDMIDERYPLRWTSVAIASATAFLALTNASVVSDWIDTLTPGPVVERVRPVVVDAVTVTTNAQLDRPRRALHDWWEGARGARFGAEHPGQDGAVADP